MERSILSILITCLLLSCELNTNLDYESQSQTVALIGILNPDSAIAITLHKTARYQPNNDTVVFEPIENSTLEILEEGHSVGFFTYTGQGRYLNHYTPKEGLSYTVKALVPDHGTITASTRVPEKPSITTCFFPFVKEATYAGIRVNIVDIDMQQNAYWLHLYFQDYLRKEFSYDSTVIELLDVPIYTNSIYVDGFNASNDAGLNEHDGLARIADSPFQSRAMDIDLYKIYWRNGYLLYDMIGRLDKNQRFFVEVINANKDYDRYVKSAYLTFLNNPPQKTNGGLPFPFSKNTAIYSNIHNGTGIFAGVTRTTIETPTATCQ